MTTPAQLHAVALARVRDERLNHELDLLEAGDFVARVRDLLRRGSASDRRRLAELKAEREHRRARR